MTKLKYPKNGLYIICREELSRSAQLLSNACNSTGYSIPGGFSCSGYMQNLPSILSGYLKTMNTISTTIQRTNRLFEDEEIELTKDVKTISEVIVEERERLIIS